MLRRTIVLAAAFLALAGPCFAQQVEASRSLGAYWDDYFQRSLGAAPAGYAFAVRDGDELIEIAQGYQRLPNVAMRPDTQVHLASISKTITALALLNLLNDRGIDLDARFWPHLRAAFGDLTPGARVDQITFAQLLAHRSGLPTMEIDPPMMANLRDQLAHEATASGAFLYSNLNYTIARALIETISGETYESYVRRVVLAPAGVTRMTLRPEPNQSFIHRAGDGESMAFDRDFAEDAGGYGWYGAASDVAAIFAHFAAGTYLTPALRERMARERLGIYTFELANGRAYSSDGHWSLQDGRGSKTAVAIFPGDVVVALVMNTVWDGNLVGVLTDGYRQNVPTLFPVEPVRTPSPLVRVTIPWHARDVRCALDGSDPTASSQRYQRPVAFDTARQIRCAGFNRGRRVTHISRVERP